MAEEKKTITILLFRYDVPRVNITYKDKKDLFRKFKEELSKHHLSIGEVSWTEYDNTRFVRSAIRNADDLLGAAASGDEVRIYCRPKDGNLFTPPSSDDDGEMDGQRDDARECSCSARANSASKSAEAANRVSIKLLRDNPPRLTITYEDKKDLFKQFQRKIKGLNLPDGNVYRASWRNDDRDLIQNADDLMRAVENQKREENTTMKMYYRREGNSGLFSCHSSDED